MQTKKNPRAETREILSGTVLVRRGSKSQELSLFGAILLKQADKALQGNDRSAKVVFDVGRWHGVFEGSDRQHDLDLSKLTDDELNTLERIIAKSQRHVRQEGEE